MFWDFISLRAETTHQVCFLFSDRGIPDGYQHMNGYGSHTFKMVNDKGEAVYCKFHLKVLYKAICFMHPEYYLGVNPLVQHSELSIGKQSYENTRADWLKIVFL